MLKASAELFTDRQRRDKVYIMNMSRTDKEHQADPVRRMGRLFILLPLLERSLQIHDTSNHNGLANVAYLFFLGVRSYRMHLIFMETAILIIFIRTKCMLLPKTLPADNNRHLPPCLHPHLDPQPWPVSGIAISYSPNFRLRSSR